MTTSNTRKPWGLPVIDAGVPGALKAERRWLTWAAVASNGKWDKVPKVAGSMRGASVNDPDDWRTYKEALHAYNMNPMLSGIGLALTGIEERNGYHLVCIDLDKVEKHRTQHIVDALPIYWERSPSSDGRRGFAYVKEVPGPSFLNREHGVEVYFGDSPRYVTVTGQRIGSIDDVVVVDQVAFNVFYERYRTSTARSVVSKPMPIPRVQDESWAIAEALRDALPERFQKFLDEGDTGAYDSRSELVHALCMALFVRGESDEEVWVALYTWDQTWQYALSHRKQDYDKAFQFLWDEVCAARARVPEVEEKHFEDMTALDAPQPAHQDMPPPVEREAPHGLFRASQWAGVPVQPVQWLVPDWIPKGEVTLYTGDGGLGKSLSMQQLQTALALGADWLGLPVCGRAVSMGIYCEDAVNVLHVRQQGLNKLFWCEYEDLDRALLISRKGAESNYLAIYDGHSEPTLTKLYEWVNEMLTKHKPELLVLDTLADMFAGNENDRAQVRNFVSVLNGIAMRFNVALVLCGHPSRAGLSTGEGSSGSTAWHNSVRSRLYLTKDEDTGLRVLKKMKSNYGPSEGEVRMAFDPETLGFVTEKQRPNSFGMDDVEEAKLIFMDGLRAALKQGSNLSDSKNGHYAPKLIAQRLMHLREREVVTEADRARMEKRLEGAMAALYDEGKIVNQRDTRNRTSRIVEVTIQ